MKTGIKKVEVICNNCGSNRSSNVTTGIEHEYDNTTDDEFTVVKCSDCGLHYLNPRPDVSELPTIYPSDYYAYHLQTKNVESENQSSLLYKARKHIYLSRLEAALAFCQSNDNAVPLKVLDVGCADGRALNWYKKIEKYQVETFGVDFDEVACERARAAGHTVFQGRFETTELPTDFFDMAIATHVIEHVENPREFAATAFRVLKPKGTFLVETPNIDSFDARLFRNRHWGGYHFPRHWVFYSEKTLRALMTEVGFEIVRIEYHPAPAFWNWSFHSLFNDNPAFADRLFPPTDFQKNNLKNLCAASFFTGLDILQKAATGKTSNMSMLLRKP